ncbi:conserved hypothetical protein [Ricinus communis]|uniref:Endonuclease/exonuclease/phosphatase domain-containing protein n=1 Tax=Ricinus communis TaxID=3988 RepID=B9RXB0_RICCO|nr:conserved hypothetical protein [Ricinus communis]
MVYFFFYGDPRRSVRFMYFFEVTSLKPCNNDPWLVIGDFNAIDTNKDKIRGKDVPPAQLFTLVFNLLGKINVRERTASCRGLIEPMATLASIYFFQMLDCVIWAWWDQIIDPSYCLPLVNLEICSIQGTVNDSEIINCVNHVLFDEMNMALLQEVWVEEVREAMFSMGLAKAPDLDGFPAWNLLVNPVSLLAKMVKNLYFPGCSFWEANIGYRPSWGWRSLAAARNDLKLGASKLIGNDGWWDLPELSLFYHHFGKECHYNVPSRLYKLARQMDLKIIKGGIYTVKFGHFAIKSHSNQARNLNSPSAFRPSKAFWKSIWKVDLPPKL